MINVIYFFIRQKLILVLHKSIRMTSIISHMQASQTFIYIYKIRDG